MSLTLPVSEWGGMQAASIEHALRCTACGIGGLGGLLNQRFTCQDALLAQARLPYLLCSHAESIQDILAAEHIWGIPASHEDGSSMKPHSVWALGRCREYCRQISAHWDRVPMSSSAGDGPNGPRYTIPLIIQVFRDADWPLEELRKIQADRLAALQQAIVTGDVRPVSGGHYHCVEEVVSELKEHIRVLECIATGVRYDID